MFKVNAHCVKQVYKNGDYTIFSFCLNEPNENIQLSSYGSFSCKGEYSYLSENKDYEMEIELISTHQIYGGTYAIKSIPSMEQLDLANLSKEESFEILMDCTSSERIANNILSAYPDFISKVLTEGKESIDTDNISGVGEAYLNAYVRELTSKYKYYHLLQEFKDYEVDVTDCKALCSNYIDEDKIKEKLKKRPYEVLIDALGRNFINADKMILNLNPEFKDSKQRCEYLMLSVLDTNEENGSTRLNANSMYYYIEEEYNVPELLPLIVETVKESELIYYDEKTKDVAKASTYTAECMIADFVKNKIKNSNKLNIDWEKYKTSENFTLSDMQMKGLENFCNYNFSIIAGFSGSGKTQSVKGLISLMEDNGINYTLLSPTGKASKVLSESTNRPSSTIHRKVYSGEINTDVLIIDEAGMIALDVFTMLLNDIVNENIRIILIGDPSQLSSIGLSKIFDDLINSEIIPMTMLTEIFRYKSDGSLFVATNLRNGISFFDDKEMVKYKDNVYSVGSNYKFIEKPDDEIIDTLVEEYVKLIKSGVKPIDIMVLSPFNKSELGTYEINNRIQAEINPQKPNESFHSRKIRSGNNIIEITFRVGDIIINTKNDYSAIPYDSYILMEENEMLTESDVETTLIVNGQQGIIHEVVPKGLIVQCDEELIFFSKQKLNNILLGFSLSSHKSQGSSVDVVIGVVSNQHKKMLSRGLLYVMDTRNRKKCINIGSAQAFENALQIVDNDLRDTWLLDLLKED